MVMWGCGFGVPKGKVLGFKIHSQNYALSAASSQAFCWALGIGKWIRAVSAFRAFTVSCGQPYLSRWSLCSSRRGTRCAGSTAAGQGVKVSRRTLQSGWVWSRGKWRVCKIDKKMDPQGRGTVMSWGGIETGSPIQRLGFLVSVPLHTYLPHDLIFYWKKQNKKENWGTPCPPSFLFSTGSWTASKFVILFTTEDQWGLQSLRCTQLVQSDPGSTQTFTLFQCCFSCSRSQLLLCGFSAVGFIPSLIHSINVYWVGYKQLYSLIEVYEGLPARERIVLRWELTLKI